MFKARPGILRDPMRVGIFVITLHLVQRLHTSELSPFNPSQAVILAAISVGLALAALLVFLALHNRSRTQQQKETLSVAAELTIVVVAVFVATVGGAALAAVTAFLFPGLVDIKTQLGSIAINATGPLAVFIVCLIVFVPVSARIALRIASRKQKSGAAVAKGKDRAPIVFVPPSRPRK
ncbi:MAG TPA: hypothetical protein VFS83_19670 [Ktedonobacterales bacterium]|nr:hypothetical protein [Ktedonobacterales bacterium]